MDPLRSTHALAMVGWTPRGLRSLHYFSQQPRYGRRVGDSPRYTRQQNEAYKSQRARLERARQLLPNWSDLVREENLSESETVYRIASNRSPWGYWTVTRNKPPDDSSLGDRGDSGSGSPAETYPDIYVAWRPMLGDETPGVHPEIRFVPGPQAVRGLIFPVVRPSTLRGATPLPTDPPPQFDLKVRSGDSPTNLTLNQLRSLGVDVFFQSTQTFQLDSAGPILDAGDWITIYLLQYYGDAPPAEYRVGFDSATTIWRIRGGFFPPDLPPDYDTPLVPSVQSPSYHSPELAIPLSFEATDGAPTDPLERDPNPPPRFPPLPGAGQPPDTDATYTCDCPDYTRLEYADRGSPYPSRWRDREWVDSDAGADGPCKHIYLVQLYWGEAVEPEY